MDPTAFDLAGCCVGVVERDRLIDATAAEPGDAIVGLAANGLHANGFSLVRSLIAQWDLDLARPYQEQLHLSLGTRPAAAAIRSEPEHALATLGEVLLAPTRIYSRSLLALRETLVAAGHDIKGLAHITGGGLSGNVHRALPSHLGARLDPTTWQTPSVMRLMSALGGLDDEELRSTFNGGLGMVVVVSAEAADATIDRLAADGIRSAVVGEVVTADSLGGARYAEGPLS
jgi:phosphoribosylformylglycinamidine cyclo-ligase